MHICGFRETYISSVYLHITDSSQRWCDANVKTRNSKSLIIFQLQYYYQ